MGMTNSRYRPVVGPLLSWDKGGSERKHNWKYRALACMLRYLQDTSRPDILMATHQCTRFATCTKLWHERAVKRIYKYLLGIMDNGMIYRPDMSKELEWYVDADFTRVWTKGKHSNTKAVLSFTGLMIYYTGYPVFWQSKLQREKALNTTELEYIALLVAMQEVLPFLNLMTEIKPFLPVSKEDPKSFCTIWEDRYSCVKVAERPKFTLRTKHIALKCHHFWQFTSNGTIKINPINTLE